MSDPMQMLQAARNERAHAKALLEKWDRVVVALEDAMGTGTHAAGNGGGDARDLADLSTPKVAEALLREAGEPVHVMELVRRGQSRGFRPDLKPQKLRTYFVSAMTRSDKFKNTGKARYTLAH